MAMLHCGKPGIPSLMDSHAPAVTHHSAAKLEQSKRTDSRMDLEVIFGKRVITTPVYLKMEAHDPLLLSEGVCRQLGIISYHTEVRCSRKISVAGPSWEAVVPVVKVQLIQSAKILPQQSVQVTAKVEESLEGTWLLEPDPDLEEFGVCAQESLLQ